MKKRILLLATAIILTTPVLSIAKEDNSYTNQIIDIMQENPIEDKTIQVNKDTGAVKVDGKVASLKNEIETDKSSKALVSEDVFRKELEENGYEVVTETTKTLTYENKFATKRLIVKAPNVMDNYGAIEEIKKNNDFLVLQYETSKDAATAYEKLINDKYNVIIDEVIEDGMLFAPNKTESIDDGSVLMGLDKMQRVSTYQKNTVKVAVIDSGMDTTYLADRIMMSKDFSSDNSLDRASEHGTYVGGIISDGTPDNIKLLNLKIFNSNGKTTYLAVDTAITYAIANGADVINMSIGLTSESDTSGVTVWNDSIDSAISNNIPVIVASGNNGTHTDYCYPASYDPCWTIGAISDSKITPYYSNYGEIDFVAPGQSITMINGNVDSGTSYATPHITALTANLLASGQYSSLTTLYNSIKAMCEDLGTSGYDESYGFGFPIYSGTQCSTHNWILTDTVVATCDENGSSNYVCNQCGNIKSETITSSGHKYIVSSVTKATCCSEGITNYKCEQCKKEKTEKTAIDSSNHSTLHEEYKAATCQEAGFKEIYCEGCKVIINKIEYPIANHVYKVTRKNATLTTKGYILQECENCTYSKKYILPVLTLKQHIEQSQISSLKLKNTKKKLTITFKKIPKAKYQIKYATNKKFKKAKIKTVSKNKLVIKKPTKKKTYYVKVRAYKKIDGKTVYGKWSTTKKIKIKR